MDKDDHLELDDSALLDPTGTKEHQSLIGAPQWFATLGRFDIVCSVMIMSRFLCDTIDATTYQTINQHIVLLQWCIVVGFVVGVILV